MKILIVLAALGGWQTQYTTQTQYQKQCQGGYCTMVPVQVQVPTTVWVPDPPRAIPQAQPKPRPKVVPAIVEPIKSALQEPTTFRFY